MKILVVGGAGYIGSMTAHVLAESGYTPIIFDNLSAGHKEAVSEFEFYQGDINNFVEISSVIDQVKPDAVMHFAAYLNVGESVHEPIKYFQNNVGGTLNLCNAMVQHGVNKLVFSSTCATYGQPDILPVTEKEKESPESPYGESKLIVEKMLEWIYKANGLSSIRLRYFNVAGAWPDGTKGEDKTPYKTIVPIAMMAAIQNEQFTLNGTDYDTPDGTCIRDYIHVVDLAKAHVDALKFLNNNKVTDYYNVGVGIGYSNKQIIEAIEKYSGKKLDLKIGPRREGDPAKIFADNTKITSELGWNPQFNLEDIVKHAWDWHTSHPRGYGT